MARFSIITVTYNAEATLEKTLQSVVQQEGVEEVEYIVVDGGSQDGTMAIVDQYRSQLAEVISEPDEGIYDAMNKGIARAKGDWIGLINADDWYAEGAFATVSRLADAAPAAAVIVGGMMRVTEDLAGSHMVQPPTRFSCLEPNNHPATFVRRDVYERLGGFDTRYQISADLEFILRVQADPETKILTTPVPLAHMRIGGVSYGFDGVGEAFRIEAQYQGMASALRLFGRKVFQKSRSFVAQRLLSPAAYSRLQRAWWSRRHAGSQPIREEDVHT